MKISRFSPLLLSALLMCCSNPAGASSDQSEAHSKYVSFYVATSEDHINFYCNTWRRWMQVHRAIEKTPSLQRAILRLPKDSTSGHRGAEYLIHRTLSSRFIKAQPTHVYTLQLGIYDRAGLSRFMKHRYASLAFHSVYPTAPKDFRVVVSSECTINGSFLYALPSRWRGQKVWRLCYGLYESRKDANRDAAALRKFLKFEPVMLRRQLTPYHVEQMLSNIGDWDWEKMADVAIKADRYWEHLQGLRRGAAGAPAGRK